MSAGIYRLGAGLGPASAFLYSGPAINILAIFLTARVLGLEIGLARAIGAVAFALVIGILMALIFRREERARGDAAPQLPPASGPRGILSVLLSPCHLTSIPLIVAFIGGQGRISARRAFLLSSLFAGGILVTIAAIGAVTAAAGRAMGDIGAWGNWLVAVISFLVGLHLLDVIPMPWSGPGQVGMKRRGALAAFILGLVFGIALGPCTLAYMAPILAMTFKLAATSIPYGVMLLLIYGLGHCSVIVAAGTFSEAVQHYLDWNERSKGAVVLKKVCGVPVILGGLYLIWIAP